LPESHGGWSSAQACPRATDSELPAPAWSIIARVGYYRGEYYRSRSIIARVVQEYYRLAWIRNIIARAEYYRPRHRRLLSSASSSSSSSGRPDLKCAVGRPLSLTAMRSPQSTPRLQRRRRSHALVLQSTPRPQLRCRSRALVLSRLLDSNVDVVVTHWCCSRLLDSNVDAVYT
jgi:hypothetical protein